MGHYLLLGLPNFQQSNHSKFTDLPVIQIFYAPTLRPQELLPSRQDARIFIRLPRYATLFPNFPVSLEIEFIIVAPT